MSQTNPKVIKQLATEAAQAVQKIHVHKSKLNVSYDKQQQEASKKKYIFGTSDSYQLSGNSSCDVKLLVPSGTPFVSISVKDNYGGLLHYLSSMDDTGCIVTVENLTGTDREFTLHYVVFLSE